MGNKTCISFDIMIAHTKRTINIDWDNQNKHLTKGYSFLLLAVFSAEKIKKNFPCVWF